MATALLKSATTKVSDYTGGLISGIRKNYFHRVPVFFERGDYIVKTADSRREFWQVMKLRYDVFHKEYKNKKFPFGLDKDEYDRYADHLIIMDKRINKVVGTYRLICSTVSEDFYSQTEFNIDSFLATKSIKVELSRACIHKDFRNGVVISLLWRGLTKYIQESGAKYLFGLASVKTVDPVIATKITNYFDSTGALSKEFNIEAVGAFKIADFHKIQMETANAEDLAEHIPPLVKSYLRAGAKIFGDPAIDRDFNCTDYFMILDMEKLSKVYDKKFQVNLDS